MALRVQRTRKVEAAMENNSTQGWAVLILLLAFTFLSISLFYGGSLIFLLLAVVTMAVAIVVFRKAKALENQE
jgi:Flp pilus assembly protein TadB